jgi:hypothetical protein
MGFYDLNKEQRLQLADTINKEILAFLQKEKGKDIINYFSDEDTYIRKTAYLAIGKIWKQHPNLHASICGMLNEFFQSEQEKVRQTAVNAAGEIGMTEFDIVEHFFDRGLFDTHHMVRNAVIGSIKKMSDRNPEPVLKWAGRYVHHPDQEVRREICHGVELRGRRYPQDILPLLKELQYDKTARVKNTLVHVLGQIAYKKGCIETVVQDLKSWGNKGLVLLALAEIVDVHARYKDFSALTQQQAIDYIDKHY